MFNTSKICSSLISKENFRNNQQKKGINKKGSSQVK